MQHTNYNTDELNNLYYNIVLHNTGTAPIPITVKDQRAKTLIDDPSEYEVSIVRFTIPTSLIPILIAPSFINQYSVTLTFNGTPYQQFVPYTQTDLTNLYPTAQTYYNYQDFLNDVNTAFNTAFGDLKTVNPGCVCMYPPSLFYDANTQRINMYIESTYIDGTVNGANIFMNKLLFNLLQAFSVQYFNTPAPTGMDVRFIILSSNTVAITNITPRLGFPTYIATLPAGNLIQLPQSFTTLSNFTSIRSVVLTSGLIPTLPEFLPDKTDGSQSNQVATNSKSIISDFEVTSLAPQQWRSNLTYLPTAEYRMISLLGNQPLTVIDINAYFVDVNGVFYPLSIDVNQTFNVKFLFRSKF